MTKFEYKEPEFKVVVANCEDVLTASNPVDPSTGRLGVTSMDWETDSFSFNM